MGVAITSAWHQRREDAAAILSRGTDAAAQQAAEQRAQALVRHLAGGPPSPAALLQAELAVAGLHADVELLRLQLEVADGSVAHLEKALDQSVACLRTHATSQRERYLQVCPA